MRARIQFFFQDFVNPLFNRGRDIESTTHLLLPFSFFINVRCTLLNTMSRAHTIYLEDDTDSALILS